MPTLVGFGTFAALPEEQISEKISPRILSGDQGVVVWWSIGAEVHVEPHSAPSRDDFLVGGKDRVAGAGYACSARPDLHTVCRSFLGRQQPS